MRDRGRRTGAARNSSAAGGSDAVAALRSTASNPVVRSLRRGSIIAFDRDLRFVDTGGRRPGDGGPSETMREGDSILDAFPQDVATVLEPAYRLVLDGHETAVDVPYGDRIFAQRLSPLRGDDDEIIGGVAFAEDVTEARRAERELRHSEERFRVAFEEAPIGKALISIDGHYERVNKAMCTITGYSAEQFRGMTVGDITHPDDLPFLTEGLARMAGGGVTALSVEKQYITASGDTIWVATSGSVVCGDDGAPLHIISQIQDITERKRTERSLASEHRRLRDAQTIGHIGSWEMDIESLTVIWSDTLFELYGLDPHSFGSDYTAALGGIHPDDRDGVDAALEACILHGTPMSHRHRVFRADSGVMRWFETHGEKVEGDGRPARLAGAVIDVTDQVVSQQRLEEARDLAVEASRQKSAFLATMSHEIRTPMNAVIGMTGLLLDTVLDAEQQEFAETVRSSGDSLLFIINDILDFSKIEAGGLTLEHRAFNLRDCVADTLDLVAATSNASGLELVGHVDDGCPTEVVGDVTRVRQVLINLLGNATKFTTEGEVVLSVEPTRHTTTTELGLRFTVTDTGIGIPPDRLPGLFESFMQVDASTTRLYGGTGLGLAISQRLVQAMGGVLSVESVSGVGSTFFFSIAVGRAVPGPHAPAPAPWVSLSDRSALVVDDNPTNRRIMRSQLESWGMHVTEATTGLGALAIIGSGARFDIALLDMKMPVMSGLEVAEALRASPATRAVPLVLLTSRGDRPALPGSSLFASILTKPVRGVRLQQSLQDALRDHALLTDGSPGRPAPKTITPRPLRVLLVEDNAVNQRLGKLMLQKLGHHVDVVGNGKEAVIAIGLVPYDAVVMDVEMPEMDGLEATRVMRSELPRQRQPQIIALTASALAEDQKACADAGMDDYLAKPVRLPDLDAALERATDRIQAHSGS